MVGEEDEFDNEAYQRERGARLDQKNNAIFPDYGDDFDDYTQKRKRKLFSLVTQEANNMLKNTSDTGLHIDELEKKQGKDGVPQPQPESKRPVESLPSVPTQASKHHLRLKQNRTVSSLDGRVKSVEQIKPKGKLKQAKRQKLRPVETAVRPGQRNPAMPVDREQLKAKERPKVPSEQLRSKQHQIQRSRKINQTQIQTLKDSKFQPLERVPLPEKPTVAKQWRVETKNKRLTTPRRDRPFLRLNPRDTDTRKHLRDKEIEMNMPLQLDLENKIQKAKMIARGKMDKKQSDTAREEHQAGEEDMLNRRKTRAGERDSLWGPGEDLEGMDDEDLTPAPVFDPEVNWSQTFQVSHLDIQAQRLDWIDLHCNISGNLLLHSSDTVPVVKAFMDQLNEKHHG